MITLVKFKTKAVDLFHKTCDKVEELAFDQPLTLLAALCLLAISVMGVHQRFYPQVWAAWAAEPASHPTELAPLRQRIELLQKEVGKTVPEVEVAAINLSQAEEACARAKDFAAKAEKKYAAKLTKPNPKGSPP